MKAKFSDKDYRRIMDKLNKIRPGRRSKVMVNAMRKAAFVVRNQLIDNVSGGILKRRTGRLAQSIESKVEVDPRQVSATIGSGVRSGKRLPYANIHETGGTIKPKNAKYLTIPTSANKTGAGQTRYTAPELFESFKDKAFFANGMLFLKQKGGVKPMFSLHKKVDIPERRYLSRTLEQTQRKVVDRLLAGVNKGLRK